MGRKATKPAAGHKAALIGEQIQFCMAELVAFKSAREIRAELSERWGLSERVGDSRIQAARERMRADANASDRVDVVAVMMEQCLKIAKEASETRQLSNAIGAMRLYGELIGVAGNHRV